MTCVTLSSDIVHILLRREERKMSLRAIMFLGCEGETRCGSREGDLRRNQANRQGDVMKSKFTLDFSEIRNADVALVGGKNASLGELFSALKPKGVGVLDGFALTTDAYWRLLEEQGLRAKLADIFADLDPENLEQLAAKAMRLALRSCRLRCPTPRSAIRCSYVAISSGSGARRSWR